MKKVLILTIGLLIGFSICSFTTISVKELKTTSNHFVGNDDDVAFANNLGLASFDGAWVSVSGDQILNYINSVAIDCWLDRKTCDIAQANIMFKDTFSNKISYYEIKQWSSDGQITAVSSSLCENQTLKADIKTKVVTLTEARKENADEKYCTKSSKPVVLKLDSRGY